MKLQTMERQGARVSGKETVTTRVDGSEARVANLVGKEGSGKSRYIPIY